MSGKQAGSSLRDMGIMFIPGVGPERAARLQRLGLHSVYDLLMYFPFRYEFVWQQESVALRRGAAISVVAAVSGPVQVRYSGKRSMITVPIKVGERAMKALFFNQPYLKQALTMGKSLRLRGKFDEHANTIVVSGHEAVSGGQDTDELIPIYRSTEDLSNVTVRKIVATAMRANLSDLPDELPRILRQRFRLMDVQDAVKAMHYPKTREDLRQARRRLIFEEFLGFQLRVQGIRYKNETATMEALPTANLQEGVNALLSTLPYTLTNVQKEAIRDIIRDIASPSPMHRLLQGDVGSGKTVVAFAAVAALAKLGYQSALMAPTGILALQHAASAREILEPLGIRVACVLGGQDANARQAVLRDIAEGRVDLVVGTHALITETVVFRRLRLVVVDEQHRFGVVTRKSLRQKGPAVDVLQLSATPIPRSLALTLYGDMTVSSMRELPPGRKPIQTTFVKSTNMETVLRLLRTELANGRQAYIVTPRIEPALEDSSGYSAIELYSLLEEELGAWRVGLIHGQLSESERMAVMTEYARGDIQALVATTIVEVGVNVKNATVMAIFGAERFGLATLHQLRGRVGRSDHPSYCVLVGTPLTPFAKERIAAMLETQDGFILAERDLRLRGPGEVFGERQSGLPIFRVGDVMNDFKVMEAARDVAAELLNSEDFWLLPAFTPLRKAMELQEDFLADS